MGAEADGLMLVNERGVPVAHAGLAMTLRDLARFGLLFMGGRGLPEKAVQRILKEGRPELLPAGHPGWYTHASYQWDQVHERGVLAKGGFGNQGLYIDIPREVVVVMFGTNATLDAKAVPMPVLKLVPALFPETAVKRP